MKKINRQNNNKKFDTINNNNYTNNNYVYIFLVNVCYEICYIETLVSKYLSFRLSHGDEGLSLFTLSASVLGLIFSVRLDGRKNFQSENCLDQF